MIPEQAGQGAGDVENKGTGHDMSTITEGKKDNRKTYENKTASEALLKVSHLSAGYVSKRDFFGNAVKKVYALRDVSFTLSKGDTMGIVGESGCGKSTLAKTLLRLVEPESGSIEFDGNDMIGLSDKELRHMRKRMQMVFQDPYASLNPQMTVGEIIGAPLRVNKVGDASERYKKILEIMRLTGLSEDYIDRYPSEFSGGQRQRIMIARTLILQPDFVIFDEPVSALDVSVRAQILNLINELKKLNFTSLFISHDLSVIKYICNKIAVMYLGRIVELADTEDLFNNPLHPYTRALISSIPVPVYGYKRPTVMLEGQLPNPMNPPTGCPFHTRCPYATELCRSTCPKLTEDLPGHYAACHYSGDTKIGGPIHVKKR